MIHIYIWQIAVQNRFPPGVGQNNPRETNWDQTNYFWQILQKNSIFVYKNKRDHGTVCFLSLSSVMSLNTYVPHFVLQSFLQCHSPAWQIHTRLQRQVDRLTASHKGWKEICPTPFYTLTMLGGFFRAPILEPTSWKYDDLRNLKLH